MNDEPSVAQEVTDRQTQNAKLLAFLKANPLTFWSQATLAESCGAAIGAVRTRLSELKRDPDLGGELVSQSTTFERDGKLHRGLKQWSFVPRPSVPLGRDASIRRGAQLEMFS